MVEQQFFQPLSEGGITEQAGNLQADASGDGMHNCVVAVTGLMVIGVVGCRLGDRLGRCSCLLFQLQNDLASNGSDRQVHRQGTRAAQPQLRRHQ
ncbi:MAG: hypothetical protein HC838_16635 [Spirulinaceae cyanobacterium RM2_2_10]|nr:hypothetical protein [Spirulinaceae cyanobacterium RM2_2_10]